MSERPDEPFLTDDAAAFKRTCKWTWDDDRFRWHTECGRKNNFFRSGLVQDDFIYCPYCGLKIEVVR